MELLRWIQNILPPAIVAYGCPVMIIGCLLLAFGDWLYPKWQTAGITYTFSLITVPLVEGIAELSHEDSVLVGGLFAPAICGFLLVFKRILQSLNSPGGSWASPQAASSSRSLIAKIGRGLLGGGVGGVLGLAIGGVVSLLALMLLSLLAVFPSGAEAFSDSLLSAVLDSGIYTFGSLGSIVGLAVGTGYLQLWKVNQRLLISAVICSALMTRWLKSFLKVPGLAQGWQRIQARPNSVGDRSKPFFSRSAPQMTTPNSSIVEVIEAEDTLTLRCRVYRSSDWVWMGFNGLYDGLVLLLIAIALLRGTWASLGLVLGLLLLTASLWTWHSLTRLCNTTILCLNATHLTRSDTPFSLGRSSIRLARRSIAAIKATAVPLSPLSRPASTVPRYQVCAIFINGRELPLLRPFERWEDALFVEEQIQAFCRLCSN